MILMCPMRATVISFAVCLMECPKQVMEPLVRAIILIRW